MITHPRRPRFLAQVPENPTPEAPRFAAPAPCAPVVPVRDREPDAPPPASPPPDLETFRREAMEHVAIAVAMLRAQADRLAEQARSDAIEIAFQVARKILETEVRQSPDALFALVRSALHRAGESRRIAIRVAPEDVPLLDSDHGRAAAGGVTAARVEYVADPSLQHGDCIVEADFGQVDGRLTTRLAEIRRAVESAGEGAA